LYSLRLVFVLASFCAISGCTESRTGFDVSLVVDETLSINPFIISAEALGESTDPLLTSDSQGVLLVVPESWAGEQARIIVKGIAQGEVVAYGSLKATVRAGELRTLVIFMDTQGCEASCQEGSVECVNDGVRRCEAMADGCGRWTPAIPCPADAPHCSDGVCAASCSDECEEHERRCTPEATYQVCGQHDSDGCLEWGSALACANDETCVEGACVLQCDGKPCPCAAGETQPCEALGQCENGVRRCVEGQFGPCEWERGPTSEVCDGEDNDCNGLKDDGLIAPACQRQAGVCIGARQRCEGARGWSSCRSEDYTHAAAILGLTYEVEETRCDEQDNDCDGKTDEPVACQPDPCGDGRCEGNETPNNCPQDCKVVPCGDGTCAPNETPESCPQDCAKVCTEGETLCVNDAALRYCKEGVWKQASCETICASELGAESDGCAFSIEAVKDICFCSSTALVGYVCASHADCLGGTVCALPSTGLNGYCTRPCQLLGEACIEFWTGGNLPSTGLCTNFAGKLGCEVSCTFVTPCPSPLYCSGLSGGICVAP
ncbi:MAG: hypothetical protein JRH20_25360, partial [Deltaproteobacteria bacterium]|nr:hypothetical protein [Deltaproteobacteria bacterium]